MPRRKKETPKIKKIQPLSFVIAIVMMFGLAVIGSATMGSSDAARKVQPSNTPLGIYVGASNSRVAKGSTLSVPVYANSGEQGVNVVQAKLLYPSDKIQYLGMTEGSSFPTIAATDVSEPGVVQIARSIAAGTNPLTGVQHVATINFKVADKASGSVTISFDSQSSFVVNATDNNNILNGVVGATYTIR